MPTLANTTPGRPAPPPLLANRWRLVGRVARGATTEVWWGWDAVDERERVIKLLAPAFAGDERVRGGFVAEGALAQRLDCEGLVRAHADGVEGGWHFVVFDAIPGVPLSTRLRESGALAPERAFRVAVNLRRTLAALHAGGLAHNAVTPDNVIVDEYGNTVLIDLGAAGEGPPDGDQEAVAALLVHMVLGRAPRPDDLHDPRVTAVTGPLPQPSRSSDAGALWLAASVLVVATGVCALVLLAVW